jgi:hypothetical protein
VEIDDISVRAELGKAYRWLLRGVPAGMAVKKVQVDREWAEERRVAQDCDSLYFELKKCI